MKYINVAGTELKISNIAVGCMRLSALSKKEAGELVDTALAQGVNFFDHADIYGGGDCERLMGELLAERPSLRDQMLLQGKCGIRPGCYDFSKEHILQSADGILSRLKTDHLDALLLHRPDTLMEPEEVAEAFTILHQAGKVRYFGVSNQNSMQIELLQKYTGHKLVFNQLQMSVAHTPVLDSGLAVNMNIPQSIDRSGSLLDYCRLKEITVQAWSPFQRGFFEGVFLGDREHYPALNDRLEELAAQYNVTPAAIAVAWLTRHPAGIQVILGTTKPSRLMDGCAGSELPLTREEWYSLYQAAGNMLP